MPDTYTIRVINASKNDHRFLLFNDVPAASDENENVLIPFSNVLAFNNIAANPENPKYPPDGSFKIPNESFAVCGSADSPLKTGVVIENSFSQPVSLGPSEDGNTQMTINEDGTPKLTKPSKTKTQGGYNIVADAYNTDQFPNVWCGYGKLSGNVIVPVASWPAESATTYKIFPKVTYYIATGSYVPGEIVDVTALGPTATIDFTGREEKFAVVTKKIDNTYEPVDYKFELEEPEGSKKAGDEDLSGKGDGPSAEKEAA